MDLGWAVLTGNDPLAYFARYPGRFPLWHLKDMDKTKKESTEFGKGQIDIVKMLKNSDKSGMKYFFVEQEEYPKKVLNAVKEHSGLSTEQIIEKLEFGKGPLLKVVDLKKGTDKKVYGHCTCPGVPQTTVEIEITFVNGLEQANLASTQQATAFLLTGTMLHEFVHYGANFIGKDEGLYELGNEFETQAFGVFITKIMQESTIMIL